MFHFISELLDFSVFLHMWIMETPLSNLRFEAIFFLHSVFLFWLSQYFPLKYCFCCCFKGDQIITSHEFGGGGISIYLSISLYVHIYIFLWVYACMYACAYVYICHGTCVDVWGQLLKGSYVFTSHRSQGSDLAEDSFIYIIILPFLYMKFLNAIHKLKTVR